MFIRYNKDIIDCNNIARVTYTTNPRNPAWMYHDKTLIVLKRGEDFTYSGDVRDEIWELIKIVRRQEGQSSPDSAEEQFLQDSLKAKANMHGDVICKLGIRVGKLEKMNDVTETKPVEERKEVGVFENGCIVYEDSYVGKYIGSDAAGYEVYSYPTYQTGAYLPRYVNKS